MHAQVRINEILANNLTVHMDPDFYAFSDWIEFRNHGTHSVDLFNHTIVYEAGEISRFRITDHLVIDPGGYILTWADEQGTSGKKLHTNFTLQREGGKISLLNPSGDTLHSLIYGEQEVDISYGADPVNSNQWLFFASPSPMQVNLPPAFETTRRLDRPEFSVEGGLYEQSLFVEISSESEIAKIYYTLDGSKPTLQSPEYTGPIAVDQTTVVRAVAFDNSALPSRSTTHSYLVREGITLPVMSISMEHDHFWGDEIGFYVEGTNGLTGWEAGYGPSPKSNFNRDWRRPVHMEFFDETHQPGFSIEGQIKVYGGWSRGAVIKSLAVYPERSIDYQLFPEKPFENYESFILRNSGNDWPSTKIRDAALQSLAINELDVDLQANRPAVLFINGKFWGVLNIREKINEDYVYTNHGVDQDSVDFLENYRVVKSGDKIHYLAMMDFLNNNSLALPDNYRHFNTLVDVEECLNYFICGIYAGHGDWIYNGPNNLRLWRPRREDGRWRWLLYDTDGSFQTTNGNGIARAIEYSTILRKLMENEEARNYFINTFTALLNNAFAPERAVHMIDSLKAVIEPDVDRHIQKWKNTDEDGSPAAWKTPGSEGYIQIDDGYMGPGLSSFEAWESKFGAARTVAVQRPVYLFNELRSLFDLGMPANVTFQTVPAKGGIIEVNGVRVMQDQTGPEQYFAGQHLQTMALPAYGYKFNHWKIESYTSTLTTLINRNSAWKYHDGGNDPGTGWRDPQYDDSIWKAGTAELGYGDGGETTTINYGSNSADKHITYYFRKGFIAQDPGLFEKLTINLLRDDGAVIYLNGQEVARHNMSAGEVIHTTTASAAVGGTDETAYFSMDIDTRYLVSDLNTIAVEIHQVSPTSSDISFDLELKGVNLQPIEGTKIKEPLHDLAIAGNTLVTAVFDSTGPKRQLYINEFMASNEHFAWPHEEQDRRDWIEIYNAGEDPVSLAGMYISDHLSNPRMYRIPETSRNMTLILPGSHLVLYADGKPELGPHHLDFRLNANSEEIVLADMVAREIVIHDSISYDAQYMDVSYGRYPDGTDNMVYMSHASPSMPNFLIENQPVTGLYINELMSSNTAGIWDNYNELEDWIELYNDNDYPVELAGLFFTDNLAAPAKWRMPGQYSAKTTIAPKGHFILWADDDPAQGVRHLNFKLSQGGEQVGIYQLLGQEFRPIDTITFHFSPSNLSFGRLPDGDSNLVAFETATPGSSNGTVNILPNNSFNHEIFIYPNPSGGVFYIEIKNQFDPDATLREVSIYALDGTRLITRKPASGQHSLWMKETVDLTGYPAGVYVVSVRTGTGVHTSRVLVR
ncbi:MAG: CotH kinase family protein [Bacteroidales bacterium]|nr:CotH kinase family protein [Bacteroidales bacterium]